MFDISVGIQWVRKNISKRDIVMLVGILALYIITRIVNLSAFPIFSDEGIYIHWSQVAWKDATWRFISLTDGRQPLQTWGTIPFLKLFSYDALFAGRMFSVTTGFAALIGFFVTGWYVFGKKAGYIAALLYVVTPYFLFYDRMALVDSAVDAATIWIFLLSVLLAKTRRLDVALILGWVAGFGMLAKSSMKLYVALALLGVLFIVLHEHGKREWAFVTFVKNLFKEKITVFSKLVSFGFLYVIAIGVAVVIYNVQRLSPFFHFVAVKNTTFVLTLPELIAHPFTYFPSNILNIPTYIWSEMAFVVPTIGLIGLYFLFKKQRVTTLYIVLWLLIPTIALAFIAKVLFPRYILSLGGLLLLPTAYFLSTCKKQTAYILTALIVISVSFFHYTILFDPARIPFPQIDRGQYLEGWPAGWGIREIVDFAAEKAQDKQVFLLAEGDFGMSGDVLRVDISDKKNINVTAYWPLDDESLAENQKLLATSHVYVVYAHCKEANYKDPINDSQRCNTFEKTKPLKLIKMYPKPGNSSAIYLFELLPQPKKPSMSS